MITVFSQDEVIKDLIASERREAREETQKEIAQEMFNNGIPLDVISKCSKESAETVKTWLGLTPEA